MEDLSLHILDVAENALTANATRISILISEDSGRDTMMLEIADNGRGMEALEAARADDPFYTTRTIRKVGLGLSLLGAAAHAAEGTLKVLSTPGVGTTVRATFQRSHIDRKPLGNIAATITTLLAGRPDLELSYRHERDGQVICFSTEECRRQLAGAPIGSVESLRFIEEYVTQEESGLLTND